MRYKIAASILGLAALSTVCCKPAGGPTTDTDAASSEAGTITVGGDGLCSILDGTDSDGTFRTICATIEEIAQIVVPYILTLKMQTRDAGVPVVCKMIPTTTVCATSVERAKAVLAVSQSRDAKFLKDGGK